MRFFKNSLPDYNGSIDTRSTFNLKSETVTVMQKVLNNTQLNNESTDGGLYLGLAGTAYMLYHLAKKAEFKDESATYLYQASRCIDVHINLALAGHTPHHDRTAFLTGDIGAFAVAAAIKRRMGQEYNSLVKKYLEAYHTLIKIDWFPQGGDEVFVGRAGFLCGILWLQKELQTEILPKPELYQMLNVIVESGKTYAQGRKSPFPLMYHYYRTEYLGQAHGLSGILTVLLSFPDWLGQNREAAQLVKATVDCLLQLQTRSGNFPCAMDEVARPRHPDHELVHWCHGGPGTIYMLYHAYKVFGEDKYINAALRCGDLAWEKGLLLKGPGICHGVSGSGYVFLILYQMTKDPKHLHRALQFKNFMECETFNKHARTPDMPYSLYEGIAGKACFLSDLMDPINSSFPLFVA